jgi:multiple sugar transport system ATP-binding protein
MPANTFVASFIGSPAMNLVAGSLQQGVFQGDSIRVEGLPTGVSGNITLGFRAEDAEIVAGNGQISAPMYSIELLGEASMITWRLGDALVSIKTNKEYRAHIGDVVHGQIPADICHLFDTATGKRVTAP